MDYKDPIITKLMEKLNTEGPSELRTKYIYGDVLIVPKDELPVCTIAKNNLMVLPDTNLEDLHIIPIVMNIIYDYTNDLTQDHQIVAGVNSLYKICEGRDATYQLDTDSIMSVLRKYTQLDDNAWISIGQNEQTRIDYGIGQERRGAGIFSVEARIRFNVTLHLIKP